MQPSALLRRYPLFNLLRPSQFDIWLRASQELTFDTGQTIFQEGGAGIWVYLILDGRVRVLRRSPGGREVSLGQLGPGEIFGEYALLPPHRSTATCRPACPVRLLQLPLLPLRPVLMAASAAGRQLKDWLRLHGLLAYLREQAFLGFMSAPSALTFLDRLTGVDFQALRSIQADGLADDCWFFITRGQVCLHPAESATSEPRELGPGDCFGEQALLGRRGLPLAVALAPAHCLCLRREHFTSRPAPRMDVSRQSLQPLLSSVRQVYPWVGQQEAADCGLAALAMVARFHGLDVSVDGLRRTVGMVERGASLMALHRAAVTLGLDAQAVRVGAGQLGQVALPAIAHYRDEHYVVLYELGPMGAVVGDPAAGVVRLGRELFAQSCSGNLLLVRGKRSSSAGSG
jgi:ATP-binding cassette subfamily B protein